MNHLRATIIMDYQNVHLTGHDLFPDSRALPRHMSLVDPLRFAGRLIGARNLAQRGDMPHAILARVLVFRGQPSAEYDPAAYARSQAQKAQWERDERVRVTLRPLKYELERDEFGVPVPGPSGRPIVKGKREKGIDVLCALSLVRAAIQPETDVAILASADTDLEPALDEALELKSAKIETDVRHSRGSRTRSGGVTPGNGPGPGHTGPYSS